MEFILRCNDLKCRQQLHDRAVVTTCSHVFCTNCSDSTGLSRSTNANRTCPACGASLHNPDDVVIAGLNPSEDYRTSVLSGLSPTIITECASRALAFYSYQASQEIIYQEHLAKGLTEKYNTLNQQMDQLIHEANSQIKMLQDKMLAMQAEYASLEAKNHELGDAFKEKSRSQQHIQKLYQSLKAQVMASHVATAAGDEAENALHTVRGDRFIDRIPGTRTGSANIGQLGGNSHIGDRAHGRTNSRSSGEGAPQRMSLGLAPTFASHLQGRRLSGRMGTGQSTSIGTPVQSQRSRLPVLGGTRQNTFLNHDIGPPYQVSPAVRQPLGGDTGRGLGSFPVGGGTKAFRGAGGPGHSLSLGR